MRRLVCFGVLFSWLALLLSACGADTVVLTPTTAPTATTAAKTLTPTPVITNARPSPAPTTPPIPTTVPASPTPVPTLTANSGDRLTNSVTLVPPPAPWPAATTNLVRPNLDQHEGAMTPAFKSDVKTVQAMSAPVYNIALAVQVEGSAPQLAGKEQLFYINDTGQSQMGVYLWLYPNLPASPTDESPMAFTNLKVNGQPAAAAVENNRASLRVRFNQPLPPNGLAVIELDFNLRLDAIKGDQDYAKWSATDQILALNYWYPQLAIYDPMIGGWDTHPYSSQGDVSNSRASFFNLWLTAPAAMVVAPNGRIVNTITSPDSTTRTTQIVTGPVRDAVMALSPNYQVVTRQVGETKVTAYVLERDKIYADKVLQYSGDALKTFSDSFGTYPYAEYRVAETPLVFWGGLEFPGLVFITTRYFGVDFNSAIEFALVHETAHQWFYGMIGNDQFRHAWMDEALAQYVPVLYYEKVHNAAAAQGVLNTYMQSGYRALVTAGQDGIVDQPADKFVATNYAALVYNKGGLFYDAYRRQFGDAAFLKFARNYLQNYRYKYAWPDDILKMLQFGVDPSQTQAVLDLYRKWIQSY